MDNRPRKREGRPIYHAPRVLTSCPRNIVQFLAFLLAAALALSGCAMTPPPVQSQAAGDPGGNEPDLSEPDLIEPRPPMTIASASSMLGFARWAEGASAGDLLAARLRLERTVQQGADPTTLFRLALVLNEPRTPDADPERAGQLLARFLKEAPAPQYADLRNLAAVLARHWREQALLTRALRGTEEQAKQEHAAFAKERERRLAAEKRLEALINVERRVKRVGDPIREVKPVTR